MRTLLLGLVLIIAGCTHAQHPHDFISEISLPKGFHIDLFATDVKNARSLAQGSKGVIFVSSRIV